MFENGKVYKTRDGSSVRDVYVNVGNGNATGIVHHSTGYLIGHYHFNPDGKCPSFPQYDVIFDSQQVNLDKLCEKIEQLCRQVTLHATTVVPIGPSKEAYNILYNAMLRIIWDKDATELSPEYYRQIAQQAIIECATK